MVNLLPSIVDIVRVADEVAYTRKKRARRQTLNRSVTTDMVSRYLAIIFSVLPALALAEFTVISWDKDFYHVDTSFDSTVSPNNAAQLAYESLRLPSQSTESDSSLDIQANLLKKIKLYVILQIEGSDIEKVSQFADASVLFSRPIDTSLDFSTVPLDVSRVHQAEYGSDAIVICPGNTQFVPGCHKFDSSADVAKAFENDIEYKNRGKNDHPDLLVLSSNSDQDFFAQVESLMRSLRQVYGDDIAMQITTTAGQFSTATRRLQDTIGIGNATIPHIPGTSAAEVVSYQIILWTSVSLALVLLVALCCMCNMPIGRDSMLYAKFQTDRKTK